MDHLAVHMLLFESKILRFPEKLAKHGSIAKKHGKEANKPLTGKGSKRKEIADKIRVDIELTKRRTKLPELDDKVCFLRGGMCNFIHLNTNELYNSLKMDIELKSTVFYR